MGGARKILRPALGVTLFALVAAVGLGATSVAPVTPRMDAPPADVWALAWRANWCEACAHVDELLSALAQNPGVRLRIMEFNVTSDADSEHDWRRANALGLSAVWADHADEMGRVVLVDPVTKRVVALISSQKDVAALSLAPSPATELF